MAIQRKAIALLSGGLDSLLAVRVIQEQGILVEAVNFYTGFCVEGHTHAIRKKDQEKQKRNNALWAAEQLGIKLHIEDISEEYKDIVLNPKHGYGANLPLPGLQDLHGGKGQRHAEQGPPDGG